VLVSVIENASLRTRSYGRWDALPASVGVIDPHGHDSKSHAATGGWGFAQF